MTKEEYLSMYNIIGAAMEVHRQLGRGLDELIYHEALTMELTSNNILVENEKKLSCLKLKKVDSKRDNNDTTEKTLF